MIDTMIHITDPSVDNNIVCIADCTFEELNLETKFFVKQKDAYHTIEEIEYINENLHTWGKTDTNLINLETTNYKATLYYPHLVEYLEKNTETIIKK